MISLISFLLLTTAFVDLVVAGLVYAVFRRERDASARMWVVGCTLMAAGMVLLTMRQHLPGVVSFGLINFIMLYAMLLHGHSFFLLARPDAALPRWPLWYCAAYGVLQWGLSMTPLRTELSLVAALAWTGLHAYLWLHLRKLAPATGNPYFRLFQALLALGLLLWLLRAVVVSQFGIALATDVKLSNWISLASVHLVLIAQQITYLIVRLTQEKSQKEQIDHLHLELKKAWHERQALIDASQEERQQLLSDLHDGFGSKLASLRLLAQKQRLTQAQLADDLAHIMADLRLFVDTLFQDDVTLENALVDMRYRTESRHGDGEPQLRWSLQLQGLPDLDKRSSLNILRVMQEALHNAIGHAQARHIWLEADYNAELDRLQVSVKDDGQGLPQELRRGQGMSSMQQRARTLGAKLDFLSAAQGTEVRLTLEGLRGRATKATG